MANAVWLDHVFYSLQQCQTTTENILCFANGAFYNLAKPLATESQLQAAQNETISPEASCSSSRRNEEKTEHEKKLDFWSPLTPIFFNGRGWEDVVDECSWWEFDDERLEERLAVGEVDILKKMIPEGSANVVSSPGPGDSKNGSKTLLSNLFFQPKSIFQSFTLGFRSFSRRSFVRCSQNCFPRCDRLTWTQPNTHF